MRQAAFLRAINVGTHNRIKMQDLREACERAGLRGVTTYLQSGNLAFDSDKDAEVSARLIENALFERGLRNAAAMVRTQDELRDLVALEPFDDYPTNEFTRFVTMFRSDLPEGAAERFVGQPTVLVRSREVLSVLPVTRPQGVDLNGGYEKKLKIQGTTRYWHVVQEVAAMLERG